jgi:hypothetical protein
MAKKKGRYTLPKLKGPKEKTGPFFKKGELKSSTKPFGAGKSR